MKVVWWRQRVEEDVSDERFAQLVSMWRDGDCSIDSVEDEEFLTWMAARPDRWFAQPTEGQGTPRSLPRASVLNDTPAPASPS